jgi:hypothetical protein
VHESWLYDRLGLHPIRMLALPRDEVESILLHAGVGIRRVDEKRGSQFGLSDAVYFAARQ